MSESRKEELEESVEAVDIGRRAYHMPPSRWSHSE